MMRIPVVLATGDVVLAFAEGRLGAIYHPKTGCDDGSGPGLWMRRSTNRGRTFGPSRVIANDTGDPDSFTRFRPYLAHFFPVFSPLFALFPRLAGAVPTSHKPESRAKKQRQGRPNTVSAA